MIPEGQLMNTIDIQTQLDEGRNIEVVLIPSITAETWSSDKLSGEIVEQFKKQVKDTTGHENIPTVLLKTAMSSKKMAAIEQLATATQRAQLEMIIETLLDQENIPDDLVQRFSIACLDIKVPEEAKILIDLISTSELTKYLLSINNEILLCERDNTANKQQTSRGILSKIAAPLAKIQEVIYKTPKQKQKTMDDSLINYRINFSDHQENEDDDEEQLESTRCQRNAAQSLLSDDLTEHNTHFVTGIEESFANNHTKLQAIKTPRFDPQDIEGSLTQLELLAAQLPEKQHGQLIVMFLAAASKLELLGNTTGTQKTNVKAFTSMVRNELGLSSKSQLSKTLNNTQQNIGETFLELKARIMNNYRRLHEKEILTKSDNAIILEIFIKAIRNERVKKQLRLEENTLQTILRRANIIKQIEEQNQVQSHENDHLIESIYSMLASKKCENCGLNHQTSDCLASAKLQSKHKKATGTSRDQKFNDFSRRDNDNTVHFNDKQKEHQNINNMGPTRERSEGQNTNPSYSNNSNSGQYNNNNYGHNANRSNYNNNRQQQWINYSAYQNNNQVRPQFSAQRPQQNQYSANNNYPQRPTFYRNSQNFRNGNFSPNQYGPNNYSNQQQTQNYNQRQSPRNTMANTWQSNNYRPNFNNGQGQNNNYNNNYRPPTSMNNSYRTTNPQQWGNRPQTQTQQRNYVIEQESDSNENSDSDDSAEDTDQELELMKFQENSE